MHLSELPLTQKVSYGNDPISNTIWGLNTSYRTESRWLTNLLNKIPLLNLSKPSYISLNAEFAQLIAGHPNSVSKKGEVFVDDFEGTKTDIELSYPYNWFLASTPYDLSSSALFPEATLNNNVNYGKNRALMSWFVVDQTVFSGNSSLTPDYIRGNKDIQSDNLTRQVLEQEIFPNRESLYGTTSYLPVLNVSYYPTERGPYNVDVMPTSYSKGLDQNGKLKAPKTRWGGIMEGNTLAGATYNAKNGGVNLNSADVMIPAFLAAYGGHSVSGSKLGLFPSLLQSLPNWRITFDGLSSIPVVAKYFKSLTLNHAYNCDYTMCRGHTHHFVFCNQQLHRYTDLSMVQQYTGK